MAGAPPHGCRDRAVRPPRRWRHYVGTSRQDALPEDGRLGRALAAGAPALAAAGDWTGAVDAYERALDIDATDEDVARRLITAYRQLGEPAKALAATDGAATRP